MLYIFASYHINHNLNVITFSHQVKVQLTRQIIVEVSRNKDI